MHQHEDWVRDVTLTVETEAITAGDLIMTGLLYFGLLVIGFVLATGMLKVMFG